MRTLVVADLHLGARTQVDVLRRDVALQALCAALADVDRLVVLGDTLELRHGPLRAALDVARPVLQAIGAALGPGGEVVLVPGNHDHRLIAPWLEWRERAAAAPLGLEQRAGARATTPVRALARALAPASLDVAYPGVWLGDGVYATHGHYLDRHTTVPTLERLAAGALALALRAPTAQAAHPDDYERVLAPIYALVDAVAARAPELGRGARTDVSARAWTTLAGGRRGWQAQALEMGFALAVAGANRCGIGPLRAELDGAALRRAGLAAMHAVVAALRIDARHVLFGHTHRAGPLDGDDAGEWALRGAPRLHNCGCWVYEEMYAGRPWGGPYRPGAAIALDDDGVPRLTWLLDACDAAALMPPGAPAPA